MWWLRELRYKVAGKILLAVLLAGVIAGIGFFAYRSLGGSVNDRVSSSVTSDAVGTTTTTLPLTVTQAQCRGAIEQLDRLVQRTTRFSNVSGDQSNLAFAVYARAARTCTYNEFYEFERDVLSGWMGGQDMYNAAVQNGDISDPSNTTTTTQSSTTATTNSLAPADEPSTDTTVAGDGGTR